jgi:hypothetical protein
MGNIMRQKRNRFGERVDGAGVKNVPWAVTNRPKPVKFEYMVEHRGIKVILTNHARNQMSSRYDMPIERQKKFFLACIDGLAEQGWAPDFENHEIFIYSKAMRQGIIAAFRRDFNNNKMALVVVTVYPSGRRKGAHSDTEVVYV